MSKIIQVFKLNKMIKQFIRKAVRDDFYNLLEEIDELRQDVNTLGKNMYDIVFALALTLKVPTNKLASQFDDKKLHDYVVKFQKDLDTFEAFQKQKKVKAIAKKVASNIKSAKKNKKSIVKKA